MACDAEKDAEKIFFTLTASFNTRLPPGGKSCTGTMPNRSAPRATSADDDRETISSDLIYHRARRQVSINGSIRTDRADDARDGSDSLSVDIHAALVWKTKRLDVDLEPTLRQALCHGQPEVEEGADAASQPGRSAPGGGEQSPTKILHRRQSILQQCHTHAPGRQTQVVENEPVYIHRRPAPGDPNTRTHIYIYINDEQVARAGQWNFPDRAISQQKCAIVSRVDAARAPLRYIIHNMWARKSHSHLHLYVTPCRTYSRIALDRIFVLMSLGLLGLVIGCLVFVIQPYEFIFKWKATFGPGGEIYEIWRKPSVDLYVKIYLFNCTNAEAYMARKEDKLRFVEVGPYVYQEFLEHGNVTFNPNGTVSSIPKHPLKFVPELSNGTEEDIVVMANIALLSIANVMKDSSFVQRWGLNMLIRQTNTKPMVAMTAKEFMFGYESTLVTIGNNVMPSWIKFDRLGLIDRMYDFDGDYETVYTGETDARLTGTIDTYRGSDQLPQWTGKCANVRGASDATKFQSFIQPNDTLQFYRKSLCRSGKLIRVGEKTIKGLQAYEYKFAEHELDNGLYNPDNKCFCRQGNCLPYGMIDVTDCYYGFPIALTYPHFYQTDPSLLAAVEGLEPVKEKHESFIYVQPRSGLPVNLAFRFQINMALQDISSIENVDGFSNLVLPLLWFEIAMHELPDSLNNRFYLYLTALPVMQDVAIYCLFLGGAICLIWSVLKILLYKPKADTEMTSQWLESELQRKRLSFLHERRTSVKISKEADCFYNSLLTEGSQTEKSQQQQQQQQQFQQEDPTIIDPALLQELSRLREDIV
ncbi:unnamed protein product [Trichogramma brassicae]|uniref:Scavenger receptor class B member 1 n=1 Tax=Trichogramma brassicae TaxID=86971 RepID=A0A6H5I2F6_9HYME|nr:unnamed protein product [Trichogramma brassicae]